jgi:hypothetical protein
MYNIIFFRSAYMHFSKSNSQKIKEELVKDGKEAGMGAISTAVSTKVSFFFTYFSTNLIFWYLSLI